MSAICEICGKEFKNTQGLRGHKTFVHQLTSSSGKSAAPLATEQQPSKLEERLQKLEWVTGLIESDLGLLLSDGELPLTNKLTNITEQVTKIGNTVSELSDTVSKLSEGMELAKVSKETVDVNKEYYDKRLGGLREAHSKLAAVVNSNSERLRNAIDMFKGKFASAETNFDETKKHLNKVEAQLVKDRDTFQSIEQTVNGLKVDIDCAKQLALRIPTDRVVTLTLADGRDHTFREYKSPQGLRRPHKTATDLILGSRWVDLSEPED